MPGITGKSDVMKVAPRLILFTDCHYGAQLSATGAASDVDIKDTREKIRPARPIKIV
ncbi:MAG: hypothetical protein RIQ81_2471 [Pseudomonadota bacterium]|jgi:hypothetical protein